MPTPEELRALLDWVFMGRGLYLYVPNNILPVGRFATAKPYDLESN
jgi:hypothetical protein